MTHCSGCGSTLGWKKYKFQRMWRIPGYYCKSCMLELGREFDKHAKIVSPTRKCDLCGVEYYFLRQYSRGSGNGSGSGGRVHHNYCQVCFEAVSNGAVPESEMSRSSKELPRPPQKLPLVMIIFAGLGGLMMLLGLGFTMMSTGEDANVMNILFGAVTTALGFVLIRKTLKSRNLLLGSSNNRGNGSNGGDSAARQSAVSSR